MTSNIAHGRGLAVDQRLLAPWCFRKNLKKIAGMLDDSGADVIALQEVDSAASWSGGFDHLAFLQEHTDYSTRLMGANNINGGWYRLNYGNGFLSRMPIREHTTHPFGTAAIGEKGFLYAEFELPGGGTVALINVHLDFRTATLREKEMQQLIDFIADKNIARPTGFLPVVVGDFNSVVEDDDDAAAMLLKYLRSLDPDYRVVPDAGQPTFPAYGPSRTIDLVYVPSTFSVAAVHVVADCRLSDHLPVIVDLQGSVPHFNND